jgi:hypothetical protein
MSPGGCLDPIEQQAARHPGIAARIVLRHEAVVSQNQWTQFQGTVLQ